MDELIKRLQLFYYATNIPMRLYGRDGKLLFSGILPSQNMPAFLHFEKYEADLLAEEPESLYYTSDMSEHYYAFGFEDAGVKYRVVCGPTFGNTLDKNWLLKLLSDKKLKISEYAALEAYFKSLPLCTPAELRRTEPLLRYLLCGHSLDFMESMKREPATPELEERKAGVKETQRYHHSTDKDALIMDAIRNGDRERLFSLVYTPEDGPEGVLCKDDPVRSYKNLFIVSVSYTTKAVIEGGADSEAAYTLSDTLIQTVEETDSYEEITELFIRMLNAFMDLVEKARKARYTGPVYKTVEYINRHFYRNVPIRELAQRVHLSESHLLRLFKEQTGKSIRSHIIHRRIEEAKSLLRYTDHSLAVICEMTGFSDQSYMTGMFKRLTGTTPKKYRERKYQ